MTSSTTKISNTPSLFPSREYLPTQPTLPPCSAPPDSAPQRPAPPRLLLLLVTPVPTMPLTITRAIEADANRIAAIHMAAFGSNAMLHAQFPTRSVRAQLQVAIADKTVRDIRDDKAVVLVVRDDDSDDDGTGDDDGDDDNDDDDGRGTGDEQKKSDRLIISYARWNLPVHESEDYVEPPWRFPAGTDWGVLQTWAGMVENAQRRVLGRESCYRMWFFFSAYGGF